MLCTLGVGLVVGHFEWCWLVVDHFEYLTGEGNKEVEYVTGEEGTNKGMTRRMVLECALGPVIVFLCNV